MPNLVPIHLTPQAMRFNLLTLVSAAERGSHQARTIAAAFQAAHAERKPDTLPPSPWTDKSGATHFDLMPDRKGSSRTRPNATDLDVRLSDAYRLSGMIGFVALPSRTYTARGTATRNVPSHVSGLPPCDTTDPLARVTFDFMLLNDAELRHLRKYKEAKKGAAYALACATERRERDRAYWRAALPHMPRNKNGDFTAFTQYGGTLLFGDGSTSAEHYANWSKSNADHIEDMAQRSKRLSRAEELARLTDDQTQDDAETDRLSRKVRAVNIKRSGLRFKTA